MTTFGPSGVTTTSRLGFGGGGYAMDLATTSVLGWKQQTGDTESANWSIIVYSENSQVDITESGGYLSSTNLTIVDDSSNPLLEGVTGTYTEEGSDDMDMLITVLGTSSYDDASVTVPDGPTVEPTVTSAISSVDNFDQAIHIVSNDGYNDSVTFSGNDSFTLVRSQTASVSFDQVSLGEGTISIQTASGDPFLDDHSLATFDESYSQTTLLNSGSTTTSSLTAQTVGDETTVRLGPIAETGSSASSFDYEANGSSTFQRSETGIYTSVPATTEPPSGNPGKPSPTAQLVASPFAGLPTLTTISTNETWTDSISFNSDDSWSLDRTETGSGTSSFDQSLISTLTINDEVGSIDDGLGTVFAFTETGNFHAWNDGESSYAETLSLVSTTATAPAETIPPAGETIPPDNSDIALTLTHDEIGESSNGLTLVSSGSQSYQAVGITETVVESTPPTDGSAPTNTTEQVSFELATNDTWLQSLSILGTVTLRATCRLFYKRAKISGPIN